MPSLSQPTNCKLFPACRRWWNSGKVSSYGSQPWPLSNGSAGGIGQPLGDFEAMLCLFWH